MCWCWELRQEPGVSNLGCGGMHGGGGGGRLADLGKWAVDSGYEEGQGLVD